MTPSADPGVGGPADESFVVRPLTREECLAHLGAGHVGRLAVNNGGQPEIFPVNYVLDGERVVIRTGEGTKLTHASLDRVAFEIDAADAAGEGWSVVVKGTAREITTALDDISEHERQLPLAPLGATDGLHWVRIVPREITGRRLSRRWV